MDKDKPAPGPSFLKGFLEPLGYKVKVIDGNQYDDLHRIHLEISQYKFKWLGISVFSFMQKKDALKLVKNMIMLYMAVRVLDLKWPKKNFIVGEGEYALLELLKGNLDYPGINGKPPKQIESIQDLHHQIIQT